ncbi:MAG: cysteine hydrolase [candidate division NC10 bacterium]|nr:cysteine hydrolase [candidate division NC10 bacterium]MBI2455494.1 cysteine hydrolase [candidate division NC10 bacterium]
MRRLLIFTWILTLATSLADMGTPQTALAQTIVDEWNLVKVPPAPELKRVTIVPKGSALLVLDIVKQTCPPRPRCVASVPKIRGLLTQARGKGVAVIYSLVPGGSAADILMEVAPQGGEPMVTSGPDKFLGTDLEMILKEKGIQTVVVVGTAAHGAVIYTASNAALRGLKVIVPVDGMSAADAYPEQYTAWHLLNAPRVGPQVTLTRSDMIQYP